MMRQWTKPERVRLRRWSSQLVVMLLRILKSIESLGRGALVQVDYLTCLVRLGLRCLYWIVIAPFEKKPKPNYRATIEQINFAGVGSLPILFLILFVTTGIGNGSTFRMVPIIFKASEAGPVLGWTSAVAAYGAFIIPRVFGQQVDAGTPQYALYGFAVYYFSCLLVNWYYYARKNAEIKA